MTALIFAACSPAAYAQALKSGGGSLEVSEEYASKSYSFKGFQYSVGTAINTFYNSNVYADKTNEQDDLIYVIQPKVTLNKDIGNLNLAFNGAGKIYRYQNFSKENKEEYNLSLLGLYASAPSWSVPLGLSTNRVVRARGTPDSNGAPLDAPVINTSELFFGLNKTFNRVGVGLKGQYSRVDFSDSALLSNPTTPIIYSDGNRDIYTGTLSLSYDLVRDSSAKSNYKFFTNLSVGQHDFDKNAYTAGGFNGRNRDKISQSILSGLDVNYKNFVFGKVGVGYSSAEYDDSTLNSQEALIAEANLSYIINPKFILGTTVDRRINIDEIVQGNYEFSTSYELQHNLYLNSSLLYSTYEFTDIAREDKDYGIETDLIYYQGPNWSGGLDLGYYWHDSTNAANEYDRYVIGLRLNGKL